jgi:hypothetical protein
MIYIEIKRKCGHREKIGVAGFSGTFDDIPEDFKDACVIGVMEQECKVCLPCFEKLPVQEKRRLLKEVSDEKILNHL